MRETTNFNGRDYHRYPNAKQNNHRRYYSSHAKWKDTPRLLHRDIWEFHNGTSQILSAYPVQPIKSHTEMSAAQEQAHQNSLLYSKEYETQQKHGMPHQKGESGTDNTHSNPSQSSTQNNRASSAEQCTRQKSIAPVCAAMLARSSEQTLCKEQELPVYDLMVETDHEFFAYGVLVHNCIDALAMIAQMAVTTYQTGDMDDEVEVVSDICGF